MTRCLGLNVEPLLGTSLTDAFEAALALMGKLPMLAWVTFRFNGCDVSVYSSGGALQQPDKGKATYWLREGGKWTEVRDA